ncbi:Retrovirus-related Pol polyprotein from transposon opus [Nosema granulosis]|uniref:Retrovirus-related Pol polyprotein from transposon opus n=1 Tax=Nosema granulosis TaxID=83296 RepID=A0A9P6GX50_9MICR|nr:Retrovirus-related Pol polyprotein from transposon opus [Nosema granulosis]
MVNYCREFICNFASILGPLYARLKGETKNSQKNITLSNMELGSFIEIRNKLSGNTKRAQKDFDQDFILTTDASDKRLGAILSQKDRHGNERVISTFNKNFENLSSTILLLTRNY